MQTNGTILVVEDDPEIQQLLSHQLTREGYLVRTAQTGLEALELAPRVAPVLVLLDLMLPRLSGTEVCRRLRADPTTAHLPIIMLTARVDEVDRVVGFELGADDYVTKPFSPRELMLRIRAVLRRGPREGDGGDVIRAGALTLDVSAHQAWVDGAEVALTVTEFKLLTALARRAGWVHTRAQLLRDLWDLPPDLDTRTIDTHMKRLREKLGRAGEQIDTVRGVGYRFMAEAPGATARVG